MCGFVAIRSLTGKQPDVDLLGRMSDLLRHRGPDDGGIFTENAVGLGFRRLSILDLAPSGHQPMVSADGRHVIAFNGEIYNYIELRKELQSFGHTFRSTGDTEVLLVAYQQWGRECLKRLNGMWAFVIYDRLERCLFGARDRFGVKPLFCYRDTSSVVFTSEIKAIRDSGYAELALDWGVASAFLLEERLDTDDATFYEKVSRVPAGTAFEIDSEGRSQSWRYWSVMDTDEDSADVRDPAATFAHLFEDAVRVRMRSDVPVGVLLSGGLDSTSIISSMARQLGQRTDGEVGLNAFCYMAAEFDETAFIHATVRQTAAQLRRVENNPNAFWDVLGRHLWHQDEPVHSFTSVVVYQLMELARSRGVKVLLNGSGADEVLAGYPTYFSEYWLDLLRTGHLWSMAQEMAAYARTHRRMARAPFNATARACRGRLLRHIPGYTTLSVRRRVARAQANEWISDEVKQHWQPLELAPTTSLCDSLRWAVERAPLPLYLRVEDRNSMAHGVEARLPFLDYRLVSLAFRLGSQWKLKGGYNKFLLRESMRGRIPEIVRVRAQKFGFPNEADRWFRNELYEPLRDLLASRVLRECGVWHTSAVARALERHRRGEISIGARLFDVAQFCLWMDGLRTWPSQDRNTGSSVAEYRRSPGNAL